MAKESVSEFADWLSPVLVKELRQGMRARVFVGSFLLIQGGMIVLAIASLLAASQHESTSFSAGFFWTGAAVYRLFIFPLSGLGAIAGEHKANTLELIFLSKLTARRIVFGKWLAIVAQAALLVCAMLPYSVLRYFLGGVNLTRDLVTLLCVLGGSAVLTAVTVSLSSFHTKAGRIVVVVAMVICSQMILPILAMSAFGGGRVVSGGPVVDWKFYLALAVLLALLLALALEFGASKIAPPAENHSTPKRLIGLLLAATAAALTLAPLVNLEALSLAACALIIPLCVGATSEPIREIPSVYRPFVKRGIFGRAAGRFLYPGWPAGVLYTCALLLVGVLVALKHGSLPGEANVEVMWVSLAATLLLPPAVMRAVFPNFFGPLAFAFILHGACAVLFVIAAAFDEYAKTHLLNIASVLPPCSLILSLGENIKPEQMSACLLANSIFVGASLILLTIVSRPAWAKIRELEQRARAQLSEHAA